MKRRGLVVIDVQNDFISGSLSVFHDKNAFLTDLTGDQYAQRVADFITQSVALSKQDIDPKHSNSQDPLYDFIIYSFDFHPQDHCSFWKKHKEDKLKREPVQGTVSQIVGDIYTLSNAKDASEETCELKQNAQIFWPAHCVQGTKGARLHEAVPKPVATDSQTHYVVAIDEKTPFTTEMQEDMRNVFDVDDQRTRKNVELTKHQPVFFVYKGVRKGVDSYSAFYGFADSINTGKHKDYKIFSTGLHEQLQQTVLADIETNQVQLDMIGIAYDVCVGNTAIDAAELGYKVNILDALTASVVGENDDPGSFVPMKSRLDAAKVQRININGEKSSWSELN